MMLNKGSTDEKVTFGVFFYIFKTDTEAQGGRFGLA